MDPLDRNAFDRVLQLTGASNFRDFGGQPTADGLRVRRGVLYRSNDLHHLTDADHVRLQPLGIRVICDLRGSLERQCRPSMWPPHWETRRLVPASAAREGGDAHYENEFAEMNSVEAAHEVMVSVYRRLPARCAGVLSALISHLADGELPALIHCTAGKDRTGFVCAVLLLALGVAREAVYADYLLTNQQLDMDHMVQVLESLRATMPAFPSDLPRDVLDVVNGVDARYLDAALEVVDREHGSVDGYFDAIGVDATMRERLRQRLRTAASG